MRRILGVALLALPFVVMTTLMVRQDGWRMAVRVWTIVALVVGCIALGLLLLAPAD